MSKEKKKVINENDDTLHFVLPIKLVPAQDGATKTPEIKQEAEEDEVKTEADEVKDEPVVEDDHLEPDADDVKTEDEEKKDEPVAEENSDEEEVKTEAEAGEPDADDVKTEDEEKKDEPVVTEEDDEYKLSEDLGDLKLEQEVKDKIDAAFEAIVKEKVARIKEGMEADAEKQIKESISRLEESVRLYCEKIGRIFIERNRLPLKESLRLKYFESFYGKMRKLFKENYVDLPEAEEDLAKDLKTENEELKEKQDELLKDNEKLAESVQRLTRQAKIDKVASEMFLTESERFKGASAKLLNEKISDKRFDEKLKAISEVFSKKPSAPAKKKLLSEGKLPEKKEAKTEGSNKIHPDVAAIMGNL